MAKNHHLFILFLLAALCPHPLLSSSILKAQQRSQVLAIARAELGVQERSGRNDGDRVGEYLRYTHLDEGHEWCAAFVSWCYGQAGLAEPRTPWSPALFPQARLVRPVAAALPGDIFGIWIREKGRIGHAGLIEHWSSDGQWCITLEGNHRDAVRRVRRPARTLHAAADWIGGTR